MPRFFLYRGSRLFGLGGLGVFRLNYVYRAMLVTSVWLETFKG